MKQFIDYLKIKANFQEKCFIKGHRNFYLFRLKALLVYIYFSLNKITLSSVDNSQKYGIDLAHSTNNKSCCFIESAISLAVAIL